MDHDDDTTPELIPSDEFGKVVGLCRKLFPAQLVRSSAKQVSQIIGDQIKFFRVKNLISISDKVDRICREKGFDSADGHRLALSVGLPLIEKASYQDDSFLQERWANLIANSLRPDGEVANDFSISITYVEILHQLSRLDCEVLEYLVENGVKGIDEDKATMTILVNPNDIEEAYPDTLAHISLEKLVSLGCAYRSLRTPLKVGGDGYGMLEQDIGITLIGLNLYLAASGKRPKWLRKDDR